MLKVVIFLANAVAYLFRFKTSSFLIYILAISCSQARYNVTILLFFNASCTECLENEADQMLHRDIFPRKSEVINFRWLIGNTTSFKHGHVGVQSALSVVENLSTSVDGAIFIDVTRDSIAFSSLLENSDILTVGLFQDQGTLRTQV